MIKNLVIVESPTKARTLTAFLGAKYRIEASKGHMRDLPKSDLGVDMENNFEPRYIVPKAKQKDANALKKLALTAENLYLATDPDREGEAIAWHLRELFGKDLIDKKPKRVVFHEITKSAIEHAFETPREINYDLVDAQQARRVLDRIVGYKVSPVLWKKIKGGLSAGRVQSVALRLVCEREQEIKKFVPIEYWTIKVLVKTPKGDDFEIELDKKSSKAITVSNGKDADEIEKSLHEGKYIVDGVTQRETSQHPKPPFTTSTLQQAASNRLGYTAKKTMSLAQNLYEAGLITYMRTDSMALSPEAIENIRKAISSKYSPDLLPEKPNFYKNNSKVAQEAHEAIRITDFEKTEKDVAAKFTPQHAKLFELIRKRTLASQAKSAKLSRTGIVVKNGDYSLKASGFQIVFDGYRRIWGVSDETDVILPIVEKEDLLLEQKINKEQHFTEPPARYSDATLVAALEKNGIGRPSTYAPTIATLMERLYVERIEKRFMPTTLGFTVNDFMVENFPKVVDYDFTAKLENSLDDVANGNEKWQPVVEQYWKPLEAEITKAETDAKRIKIEPEKTDQKCEKCGKDMVIRQGRFGKFIACSGYPECKNTKPLVEESTIDCPTCKEGKVVTKRTRKGRTFWGCSRYPDCEYASWTNPVPKKDDEESESAKEEKQED